jgi:hypothetical protein
VSAEKNTEIGAELKRKSMELITRATESIAVSFQLNYEMEFVMKNTLLHWLVVLMTVCGAASPAFGAQGMASSVTSMDLNAMPLVSRTLYELDGKAAASGRSEISSPEPAIYLYGDQESRFEWLKRPDWILDSLIEPLYLSLLGAALLIFGTFKRRDG